MNGYDCISCGPLSSEAHDGRDGTSCAELCLPRGECKMPHFPAIRGEDGACYWKGKHGTPGWGSPDPAHRERTEDDPPAAYKPLDGQIGFDGAVVG